ncbi:hypothetical protein [Actinoplanes sp. URMC 104]|uniref:hypothetical protein n=1 Tax=Actinoplanes sp. URMC 104 TaxID=3423409 RepID=UPI003F1E1F9F
MRRMCRYAVVGTVLAVAGGAGTYVAYADWTVPASTVKVTMKAATMPKGTKPSVAAQSGTAVVSWSAQEIAPGVKMDRYVVIAYSQGVAPKPAIIRDVAATGAVSESAVFGAAEVAGGKWKWTVTPRFASWKGAESGLSKALEFDAAPAAVLVEAPAETAAPSPAAKATAPTAPATGPTTPVPEATTSKPAAVPTTTPPVLPPPAENDSASPPASAPGEQEPASEAGLPASSSAPADISK